jgi:WXXGXW repeat (2 copies)
MFPRNLSMSRRLILPVLCALAVALAAASGFARVGVVVGFAPPVPVVEAVPPPPAPGYVWQPGYWSWNGVQYVWVPGAYVVAPFVHAVVLIARAQFAFAIGYHIPVSGLCSALQRDVVGCVVISSDRDHCNPADDPRLSRLRALGFRGKTSPGSGYGC